MAENSTIPTNKQVLVTGTTGTGKSFLAEVYLAGYDYVVKFDTKHESDERIADGKPLWRGLKEGTDYTLVRRFEDLDDVETKKIIYCPDFEDLNEDTYNRFLKWIFMRGNTILWIDELMSIGSPNSYPIELKRLITQGRSKNVGIWSCTQRPSGIPTIVMANSEYFFVFRVNLPEDRKKLVSTTGQQLLNTMPKGHQFWYYKMGDEKPVLTILK